VLRLDLSKSTIPHQNLFIRTNNGFSMSVNLGPVAPTLAEVGVVSTGSGAAYNPRCLKRDVSVWVSSQVSSQNCSTRLSITDNSSAVEYRHELFRSDHPKHRHCIFPNNYARRFRNRLLVSTLRSHFQRLHQVALIDSKDRH
jgi:hypothetical protein